MGHALDYVLVCIISLSPPSYPLVVSAFIILSSQTRKLMLTEVTQRASGQSRIHSQDYWSLEPVPFTDKTIGTLLPTPLLTMPSLHQDWNSNFDTLESKPGPRNYTVGCRSGERRLKCAIFWLPSLILRVLLPPAQRRLKVHFNECILLSWYTRGSI